MSKRRRDQATPGRHPPGDDRNAEASRVNTSPLEHRPHDDGPNGDTTIARDLEELEKINRRE
jgi:hypothetical protein